MLPDPAGKRPGLVAGAACTSSLGRDDPRSAAHAPGVLLSRGLLDALQEWNDAGETLLGPGYDVLYQTPEGAWRWVLPPAARTHR